MATPDDSTEEANVGNIVESMSQLSNVLMKLRTKVDPNGVDEIEEFIKDPYLQNLCHVNDLICKSPGFDQPEGDACRVIHELDAHTPCSIDEEVELMDLVKSPHFEALFSLHDKVSKRTYSTPLPTFDPTFHPQTNYRSGGGKRGGTVDVRTVGLHKSSNEPLGVTLKLFNNKLVIARILHGGLIHRQGLLQVGDRIIEVNGESVDAMSPAELQAMLKHSSGSVVIRVEPGFKETAGLTDLYVRAHFDFNPKADRLIPSQEAGLAFKKGDIIRVLNQDDSFWWQAVKYGETQVAGLIPSQILEERRKAFNSIDGRLTVGCMGRKKVKRKVVYSSHHSGEFEVYDMIMYEPVIMVGDEFQYKTLVLIGAPNIGRRSLKTRLLAEFPDRFANCVAHTTRALKHDEDQRDFHSATEENMREDILHHKFIEFGKHRDHLYGIKVESVKEVLADGKICVLDVHPQALKHLRNSVFRPLIIFIKAASQEGVRRLHYSARVDGQGGSFSGLSEKDFENCFNESCKIEEMYGHYFDESIVNENIEVAYEELMATIRLFSSGKRWVPANWII